MFMPIPIAVPWVLGSNVFQMLELPISAAHETMRSETHQPKPGVICATTHVCCANPLKFQVSFFVTIELSNPL